MAEDKELKDKRIPIMMTESELSAIDDWSFNNRIRSRGEAIRRLCQIGLMFDDHRAEFVAKFRAIMDSCAGFASIAQKAADDPTALTDYERELVRGGVEIMMEAHRMVLLVRTTTGIANNFKDDRDIEDIIAQTKEIWEVPDVT